MHLGSWANESALQEAVDLINEEDEAKLKNETHPYNPKLNYFLESVFPSSMNFYRETKAEAEKHAIEYAKSKQLNLTVYFLQ